MPPTSLRLLEPNVQCQQLRILTTPLSTSCPPPVEALSFLSLGFALFVPRPILTPGTSTNIALIQLHPRVPLRHSGPPISPLPPNPVKTRSLPRIRYERLTTLPMSYASPALPSLRLPGHPLEMIGSLRNITGSSLWTTYRHPQCWLPHPPRRPSNYQADLTISRWRITFSIRDPCSSADQSWAMRSFVDASWLWQ
ncbi:hypothetical protein LY78DRAFT_292294 [Colletotrichum sublineola]|nr:hypothetical protein LY78DRAFT_292294 [Colletotrichum sublineola]